MDFIQEAQKFYNEGKYLESKALIDRYFISRMGMAIPSEDEAEGRRLRGWNWYYIGIKGLADKESSLNMAEADFQGALKKTADSKKRISILNGLPLVLWILGEKTAGKREEAWRISDLAIRDFPDESSVWNTRGILSRWAGNFEESVKVGQKVYEMAAAKEDYRTAGHGKQNQGDALKALGRAKEAKEAYTVAIDLYQKFEKTGQSAEPHIKSVRDKLQNII